MIILDRFEENTAVLETADGMLNVSRCLLPPEAAEGDVLRLTPDGYVVDNEQTQLRREKILSCIRNLKKQS